MSLALSGRPVAVRDLLDRPAHINLAARYGGSHPQSAVPLESIPAETQTAQDSAGSMPLNVTVYPPRQYLGRCVQSPLATSRG
ncbi:Uncharacterised protein [Vibrio cholerae]|uniref:Uncharacterized protein n=1 Tax=Vibrio cholerae TaxID=666 RepID=A0A655RYW9_VIBCL|nr:Uncharacterised protein [Vibrio cholerae]CSB14254.1 Uncharacterised protein [Vibrio cholerae]CSB20625.1 Uncharacterised protein [Vibrio cholerae]CSB74613.1 Uncharacterised protein [Vibrio cholerae]CSC72119.1 Uncharacterised protein [Vibrio cholerae]